MRTDLNKQLCERQRHGSGASFRAVRHLKKFNGALDGEDYDNAVREGVRMRYTVEHTRKDLNENLNPLFGMVRKNAGRPWNKVYSELCSVFNMRSVINQHILQHLFDMVEINTFLGDSGVVMCAHRFDKGAQPAKSDNGPEYYVHPVTGILLKNTAYRSYNQRVAASRQVDALRAKTDPMRRVVSDTLELRRRVEGGPWLICELEAMPYRETKIRTRTNENGDVEQVSEEKYAVRFDAWLKRSVLATGFPLYRCTSTKAVAEYRKPGYYVKTVRSASKRELKQYGLSNG